MRKRRSKVGRNCRATDWVFTDKSRTRFVRLDGYNGTPTAEVVLAGQYFVCTSWALRPMIRLVLDTPGEGDRKSAFDQAAYTVEKAEEGDPDALRHVIPQTGGYDTEVLPDGCFALAPSGTGLRRIYYNGGAETAIFIQVPGPGPVDLFVVVIKGDVVTTNDGQPVVSEGLLEAIMEVDFRVLPRED